MYLGFSSASLDQNQITDYRRESCSQRLSAEAEMPSAAILSGLSQIRHGESAVTEDVGALHAVMALSFGCTTRVR